MGILQNIKKLLVVQLFLFYVLLISGLIINFLQLLTLIIWPFNKQLYRKLNVHLAYSLWSFLTCLGQYWSGSEVELYISDEDFKYLNKEHIICLMVSFCFILNEFLESFILFLFTES
jgi:lysophosphatidic acid acyltransferase/lysophosphatidylinositol acyltransferase